MSAQEEGRPLIHVPAVVRRPKGAGPRREVPAERAHLLLRQGGVTLLTVAGKTGRSNVMALDSQMAASQEPPLVAFSIAPEAHTHGLLLDAGECVLNVASLRIVREVHYCGSHSGRDVDKFRETGLTPQAAGSVGAPWVGEAIAHLECRLTDARACGDRTLVIGEVVLAAAERGAFDEGWLLEEPNLRPIAYLGGERYAPLGPAQEVDFYRKLVL